MSKLRLTVCELPDQAKAFQAAFPNLVEHVKRERSDVVLLPEVPAHPWIAHQPSFTKPVWDAAVRSHDAFMPQLRQLAPATVLGTRPIDGKGKRLNQGFAWTAQGGYRAVHDKAFFPDEPGWYEARWFEANSRTFEPATLGACSVGFQICTEVMFNERARAYGRAGVHLIAAPRASGKTDRWEIALRMAAIASGAYVASSNRCGPMETKSEASFGGQGWLIGPDGEVLASTTSEAPFATVEIDLAKAEAAKREYPRSVKE